MTPTGNALVVDDDPFMRSAVGALLRKLGYRVRSACNGDEALKVARDWAADVVVTDIDMPMMDGLQTARCLRGMGGAWATVPIIGFSGKDTPSAGPDCLAAGMNVLVPKCNGYAGLRTMLSSLVVGSQMLS